MLTRRASRVRRAVRALWAFLLVPGTLAMSAPIPALAQSSDAPVKLSNSGICHEPGSPFHQQTLRFKPFPTLDACLRAGGRLPRGVKPMSPPAVSPSRTQPAAERAAPRDTPATASTSDPPARTSASSNVPAATSAAPFADVAPEDEAPTGLSSLMALGAASLAIAGVWWWRRTRARRATEGSEADERRRWQDHRLSKFDRADEAKLLLAVGGNRDTFERVVQYELSRDPKLAREQAITEAYARWRRDNS
jgi:hypothetical protein